MHDAAFGFQQGIDSGWVEGWILDEAADLFEGLGAIVEIDFHKAFRGEVIGEIGAAVVDRVATAEEGVCQFFRPVMESGIVFDGEVEAVGIERVVFFLDEFGTVPEEVEGGKLFGEPVAELVAIVVNSVLLFRGTDGGDGQGFLLKRWGVEFRKVVAVIPKVAGVGVDSVRVFQGPRRLASQDVGELTAKGTAVVSDGRRFGGDEQGVFVGAVKGLWRRE